MLCAPWFGGPTYIVERIYAGAHCMPHGFREDMVSPLKDYGHYWVAMVTQKPPQNGYTPKYHFFLQDQGSLHFLLELEMNIRCSFKYGSKQQRCGQVCTDVICLQTCKNMFSFDDCQHT